MDVIATNDHPKILEPCKVHYWWSWSQSGERYCGGFWCLSWLDAAQGCLDGCKLDTSCELDKCLGGSGRLPKRQRVSHCDFAAVFVVLAWFCYMNSWFRKFVSRQKRFPTCRWVFPEMVAGQTATYSTSKSWQTTSGSLISSIINPYQPFWTIFSGYLTY